MEVGDDAGKRIMDVLGHDRRRPVVFDARRDDHRRRLGRGKIADALRLVHERDPARLHVAQHRRAADHNVGISLHLPTGELGQLAERDRVDRSSVSVPSRAASRREKSKQRVAMVSAPTPPNKISYRRHC